MTLLYYQDWGKSPGNQDIAGYDPNWQHLTAGRVTISTAQRTYGASGTIAVALLNLPLPDDYSVEKTIYTRAVGGAIGDTRAGVVARVQDSANMYDLYARASGGNGHNVYFRRLINGSSIVFHQTAKMSVNVGDTFKIRLDVRGTTLSAYVDDVMVASVDDDTFKTGGVGLMASASSVSSGSQGLDFSLRSFAPAKRRTLPLLLRPH